MKKRCVHFVGFRGDEFFRAQKVFGKPDFVHPAFDGRFWEEFDPENDVAVFGPKFQPTKWVHNDSRFF